MVYTIGIKRRWFPGYTKYKVTGHRTQFEMNGTPLAEPRMILTLESGDEIAIAQILKRDFVVYSDFREGMRRREEEAEIIRIAHEQAEADRLYNEWLKSRHEPTAAPVVPITKQA